MRQAMLRPAAPPPCPALGSVAVAEVLASAVTACCFRFRCQAYVGEGWFRCCCGAGVETATQTEVRQTTTIWLMLLLLLL